MIEFKKMEEFVNKAVIVYKGPQDFQRDGVARSLYMMAIDDAQTWLRDKIIDSLKGSKNNSAKARIYCPNGGIVVSADVALGYLGDSRFRPAVLDDSCECTDDMEFYEGAERYHLTYGHVDETIHKAIMTEAGNPIEMLFSFFDKQLQTLHGYASSCGCGDGFLSVRKLEDNSICDVLGIHRYEPVIRSFMAMLKSER